jgi:putative transcriptional regulator
MPKTHKSLKGQLLLDGGKLHGSYFHRSVVLICEHNAEGAFGLVLNRPSDNQLGDVITENLPELLRERRLYGGGPVQPAAMSFLHADNYLPEHNVLENLAVGHDLTRLIEIGSSWSATQQLRVFAGYAGWAAGQLDDEMRRDSWLPHPASIGLIFMDPAERMWQQILRSRTDWKERLLGDSPEDLTSN